jgi:hypothetical protein
MRTREVARCTTTLALLAAVLVGCGGTHRSPAEQQRAIADAYALGQGLARDTNVAARDCPDPEWVPGWSKAEIAAYHQGCIDAARKQ